MRLVKLKYTIVLLLTAVILQSCCFRKNGRELGVISFTDSQKTMLPYQTDDEVTMQYGNGNTITYTVQLYTDFYDDRRGCDDYYTYETYYAGLYNAASELNIKVYLDWFNVSNMDYDNTIVYVSINNVVYYDSVAPQQTVTINGITYTDVYDYYPYSNDEVVSHVYYSTTYGILKLFYANGDYLETIL